eukprot:749647-Hanusia_phi.AAC.3
MGVPGLYRWLCARYPKSVVDAKEKLPQYIGGVRVDPDTSMPNPNGVEYDNLYLDMNGIIHPACHPEDLPAPVTEEEMYLAIYKYIDRVFNIIRPRKLLYMAVDGVAPRAKMNQQRSRRYRSAKDIEDKKAEEERLRSEWSVNGKKLPPKKAPTWDHNVITPGTAFMHRLSKFLRYYIHNRITNDPGWKNVKVVLSDASVPGEGEHKVMEFIRLQRQQKGYDPNTRHAIHGKDADLIMLALATHEPHFSILRELDLNPHNRGMSSEQLKQKHEEDQAMIRLGEADERGPAISCPPFKFIQMHIVREYLDKDFRDVPFCFPYDLEQVIDDFVLFCFFAGNDFLPHLPSLDIHEGAIGEMIRIYKEAVSSGTITGYLSSRGNCNLERCGIILQELGKLEDEIFRRRKQKEEGIAASKARREREQRERDAVSRRNTEAVRDTFRSEPGGPRAQEANKSAAKALRDEMLGHHSNKKMRTDAGGAVTDSDNKENGDETSMEEFNAALKASMERKNTVEVQDEVKLHESGWKERYYQNKFGVNINKDPSFPRKVVKSFMEGICWTLLYYYRGCPSWIWYYPFHYAPFASDFVGLADLEIVFPENTQPFLPFEQLMACLPPLSKHALPEQYQDLMINPKSPIIDFYPKQFRVDMNGKKMAWLGVALLPFIDEERLLKTVKPLEQTLNEEERAQNSRGCDLLFIGAEQNHAQLAEIVTSINGEFKLEVSSRTETASGDYINDNLFGTISRWPHAWKLDEKISALSKRIDEIVCNKCVCCRYRCPPFIEHVPKLLKGVILPDSELTDQDMIVEGRSILDGPRGRGGGGGGGGGKYYGYDGNGNQYRSSGQHVRQNPSGNYVGQTPVGRMLAMGLCGPGPGNQHGGGPNNFRQQGGPMYQGMQGGQGYNPNPPGQHGGFNRGGGYAPPPQGNPYSMPPSAPYGEPGQGMRLLDQFGGGPPRDNRHGAAPGRGMSLLEMFGNDNRAPAGYPPYGGGRDGQQRYGGPDQSRGEQGSNNPYAPLSHQWRR